MKSGGRVRVTWNEGRGECGTEGARLRFDRRGKKNNGGRREERNRVSTRGASVRKRGRKGQKEKRRGE